MALHDHISSPPCEKERGTMRCGERGGVIKGLWNWGEKKRRLAVSNLGRGTRSSCTILLEGIEF
jgi:hypothetical protein